MSVYASGSTCAGIDNTVPSAVAEEVQRIVDKDLSAIEVALPSGGVAATWIGPDDSDIAQLKCLGAAAVPYIANNLASRRPFGQLLAVRMLGWIGGKEILLPLADVLRNSTSETVKVSALEAISSLSEADTVDTLDTVAKSDRSPRVRRKASEILARYRTAAESR